MADQYAGIVVTTPKSKGIRFARADAYAVRGGFLHLYDHDQEVGVFAPGAWLVAVNYGVSEETDNAMLV